MKDDQRVALTKRLLREALLRLLDSKDIGKIRVTELCAEAGINRATFYRHYQQPRDIVTEIRMDMFHDIGGGALNDEAIREPRKWLEEMCRYFYERAELLSVLFRCRTDEEFAALINELYQKRFKGLHFGSGAAEMDEEETKLGMYFFAGGVYYILRQWITEPNGKTPQEVAGVIERFLAVGQAE